MPRKRVVDETSSIYTPVPKPSFSGREGTGGLPTVAKGKAKGLAKAGPPNKLKNRTAPPTPKPKRDVKAEINMHKERITQNVKSKVAGVKSEVQKTKDDIKQAKKNAGKIGDSIKKLQGK